MFHKNLEDNDNPRPFKADSPAHSAMIERCVLDMRDGMEQDELMNRYSAIVRGRAEEMRRKLGDYGDIHG